MAEELKTIEGQIVSIDFQKRTMALEDRAGILFYRVDWVQSQDHKIQKLKAGYYVKPTVEAMTENSGRLSDIPWAERPADWPRKQSGGKGNWPSKPRNEKPMIFESVFKSCCDQAGQQPHFDHTSQEYEKRMDRIWQVAKKISLEIIKESGA
jgi:hypothetical protein